MSKIHQILELRAPETESCVEHIVSSGLRCGYCHGEGGYWTEEEGEAVISPCPLCKGKGRMDAVVRIEWRSHE